jgi:aminomuconate-semialdehyde/2-hydroxymuconate-6-semialdehyde dehydrogenase
VDKDSVRIHNFIGGEFVPPIGGKYLDNIEPATGQPYSLVPDSDSRDVERAVDAAEKAFATWSRTPAAERSSILLRIAELIDRDLDKFARAESIDTGKPLSLARGLDIPRASSNFRFFATAILHTENEAHVTDGLAFNYTLRQPRGIAGLISPWNLPLYLLSWKIAPADCGRQYRCCKTERTDADDGFAPRRRFAAKPVCRPAFSISCRAPGQTWARR